MYIALNRIIDSPIMSLCKRPSFLTCILLLGGLIKPSTSLGADSSYTSLVSVASVDLEGDDLAHDYIWVDKEDEQQASTQEEGISLFVQGAATALSQESSVSPEHSYTSLLDCADDTCGFEESGLADSLHQLAGALQQLQNHEPITLDSLENVPPTVTPAHTRGGTRKSICSGCLDRVAYTLGWVVKLGSGAVGYGFGAFNCGCCAGYHLS